MADIPRPSNLKIISTTNAMSIARSLGETFLHIRMEKSWSQKEASRHLESSQYRISELENGLVDPKLSTLIRYANGYGYNVEVNLIRKDQ